MPVIEATARLKTVQGEYDFALDGGATGNDKVLRGIDAQGNTIPVGSVITGGYVEVLTTVTSGGAPTVDLSSEASNDIAAAIALGALVAGTRLDVVPDSTGSTAVKTTAARTIRMDINTATLTAGKFRVVLFYK